MTTREGMNILGVHLGTAASIDWQESGNIGCIDLIPPVEYAELAITGDVYFDFGTGEWSQVDGGFTLSGNINAMLDAILASPGYDLWVANQGGRRA